MTAVAGLRGTGDFATDERPKDFREGILYLKPNGNAPITALMSKMKSSSLKDPQFYWWDETLSIVQVTIDDAGSVGNTVVDFDVTSGHAARIKVGDILMTQVETATANTLDNEVMLVTAITSNNVTVNRGTGTGAGQGFAGCTRSSGNLDDTTLLKVGSAYQEGSAAATSLSSVPTKHTNWAQIFKDTYGDTNTALEISNLRSEDLMKQEKKKGMFRHSTTLEQAFLWGRASEITATVGSASRPLRTTGGILHWLSENNRISAAGSAWATMNAFLDNLYDVFDYTGEGETGGDERIVMAGGSAMNTISKAAAASGDVNFTQKVKVYGMSLQEFETPQGTFYFKRHPLMTVNPVYTKMMLVCDAPGLAYRYVRDTKSETDIQTPGTDVKEGQWLTEAGIELHHSQTSKAILNVRFS